MSSASPRLLSATLLTDSDMDHTLPRPAPRHQSRLSEATWTWIIALSCSASYALSYFWRYPIFVLPASILRQHVVGNFDLQACFSLAFIGGFGLAKMPASAVASSPFFFRHRLSVLLVLLTSSMLIEGLGLLATSHPWIQICAVFVSSFLSSWLYGMELTYLEGRRATEKLLAVIQLGLVYAGNASRGSASVMLSLGCPPRWMPLAVGVVAWVPSAFLLLITDRAPRPSAADVAARCERGTMPPSARRAFLWRYAFGLACIVLAYALLVGIRALRDLYSAAIFAAALGVRTAPPWVFLIADLPGALLSAVALWLVSLVSDSRRAMAWMFGGMVGSIGTMLGATALFQAGALGGLAWQLLLGGGFYIAFSLLGAPLNERLLAATRTKGTIAFFVFLSDCCGYVVSIGLLLYQDLGEDMAGHDDASSSTTRTAPPPSPRAPMQMAPPPTLPLPQLPGGGGGSQSELELFLTVLWICGGLALVLLACAAVYFHLRIVVDGKLLLDGSVSGGEDGDGEDGGGEDGGGVGSRERGLHRASLLPEPTGAINGGEPIGAIHFVSNGGGNARCASSGVASGGKSECSDRYDLVIVGAGMVGSAAARHAVCGWARPAVIAADSDGKRGGRVALVGPSESPRNEWAAREAFGAHHDEGRITRCTDPDPTWALLAQRSIDRYELIACQAGVQPFFTECGHLACAPEGSDVLTNRVLNARAMGVPYEVLDEAMLRARFPYLSLPSGAAGVWEPSRAGYLSARRLVAAQIEAARRVAAERGPGWVAFDRYDTAALAVEEERGGGGGGEGGGGGRGTTRGDGEGLVATATAALGVSCPAPEWADGAS